MTNPKILIADDNAIARRLIIGILSQNPDWQICGEASDGVEAVQIAKKSCPDVAILDISMPRKNGIEAAKELIQVCPNVIIVGQSLHDEQILVELLKQIGVKGFVPKLRLVSQLVPTVEAVLKGEMRFVA
jgi:two-component system, NarL family, response regulator NreC